jgi:aspartate aminotransferase-like enzyme
MAVTGRTPPPDRTTASADSEATMSMEKRATSTLAPTGSMPARRRGSRGDRWSSMAASQGSE